MIAVLFFAVAVPIAILCILNAAKKEGEHRDASETVMKPLLEKTFGSYEYEPKQFLPIQDTQGLMDGIPGGHDLVKAGYRGSDIRFCTMRFTEEERDNDGLTQTRDLFTGPWIVIEKDNFIGRPVLVTLKKAGKIYGKERVLTEDKAFDSLCAVAGEQCEVMKILTHPAREKIAGLMQRHKDLMILFESDRIRVSYGAGDYFMPRRKQDTAQMYYRQLSDLLDIINTLIDL